MRRIRNLTSVKDVAELIKLIDEFELKVIRCGKGQKYPSFDIARKSKEFITGFAGCMIIEEKETKLEITTKYCHTNLGVTTYVFSLNEENRAAINAQLALAEMSSDVMRAHS